MIAQANAISTDSDPSIGQNLALQSITTTSDTATTFKPCSPGEISGSTTPNLPTIAPPLVPPAHGCNVLAAIVMTAGIVAAGATVAAAGSVGATVFALGAAALSARTLFPTFGVALTASAASHLFGQRSPFSWAENGGLGGVLQLQIDLPYSVLGLDKCCAEDPPKAMNKLLIYVGEGKLFDFESTVVTISSIGGVTNPRTGTFVGAIFECEYVRSGLNTIVRISPELETIVLEGLDDNSLEFAIRLQERSSADLHATDMNYSFNVSLKQVGTVAELRQEIACNRCDVDPDTDASTEGLL